MCVLIRKRRAPGIATSGAAWYQAPTTRNNSLPLSSSSGDKYSNTTCTFRLLAGAKKKLIPWHALGKICNANRSSRSPLARVEMFHRRRLLTPHRAGPAGPSGDSCGMRANKARQNVCRRSRSSRRATVNNCNASGSGRNFAMLRDACQIGLCSAALAHQPRLQKGQHAVPGNVFFTDHRKDPSEVATITISRELGFAFLPTEARLLKRLELRLNWLF